MPTVPSLPSVNQAAVPTNYLTARANPNTFGAQVGASVERLGAQGMDVAVKIKAEDDARAVMDAEMALGSWEQTNLNDPEKGYFSKKGNNAIGGTAEIERGYGMEYGNIRARLANEEQRAAFDKIYASRNESVVQRVSRHEATQRQSAMIDTQNAMMKQALENAMANYTDPEAIAKNMNQGLRAIASVGTLNGDSRVVMGEKGKAFVSTVHRGVIDRMMVENPGAAQAYYQANKAQMLASDIDAVDNPLKVQGTKQTAKAESERIFAEGGGLDVMLAKAREIDDVDLSDQVLSRLKIMQAEQDDIRTQRAQNAWSTFANNPSLDNIPPEADGKERLAMQKYAEARQSGKPIKTDMGYYEELSNMTPDQLKSTVLDYNRLSQNHATYFLRKQQEVRAGVPGTYAVNNVDEVANELMAAASITDPKNKGLFKSRLRDEVEAATAQKGGKLTYQEVQKIADSLMMKTGGGWFSDGTPNYKLTVTGVPNYEIDDISNVLNEAGIEVDEANVKKVYDLVQGSRKELEDAIRDAGRQPNYSAILRLAASYVRQGNGK